MDDPNPPTAITRITDALAVPAPEPTNTLAHKQALAHQYMFGANVDRLAEANGVSDSTIYRWVHDTYPKEMTRRALAKTLRSCSGGGTDARVAGRLGIGNLALDRRVRWLQTSGYLSDDATNGERDDITDSGLFWLREGAP